MASTSTSSGGATAATTKASFVRKQDLPNTGHEWVSLDPSVQFLPATSSSSTLQTAASSARKQFATPPKLPRKKRSSSQQQRVKEPRDDVQSSSSEDEESSSLYHSSQQDSTLTGATSPLLQRLLEEEQSREDNSQYRVQPFVEGVSDYDTYQQAWRMLGFMIDCDDRYGSGNGDDDHHSGSGDAGTGEGCQRYVLWAAYVDLDYQGGGIGEYQFWDADSKKWDTTTCDYASKISGGSSTRCAKMDCHLEDTHWSLLGFFKHKGYDDWMEQLFKHEGVCVWSDEEYSFMKNARKTWPQGCIVSSTVTSSGDIIYYDIKPTHGGGITLGLYTDTRCVKEYQSSGKNDPITAENVIGNLLINGGSNDHSGDKNKNYNAASTYTTLSASLQAWDDAFGVWKQCQPCVAYDRHNYGYSANDDAYRGSSYGTYRYGYDDDYAWSNYYSNKYSGADFDCYDDAGYTNVNQCMKFMAKTTMYTATFRDLSLATAQGTLVDSPLAGYRGAARGQMGAVQTYFCFILACVVLGYGAYKYRQAKQGSGNGGGSSNGKDKKSKDSAKDDWSADKPLVFS